MARDFRWSFAIPTATWRTGTPPPAGDPAISPAARLALTIPSRHLPSANSLQLVVQFPASVTTPASTDMQLTPISTGVPVNPTGVTYNATTKQATFSLPASLPDDNYQATLLVNGTDFPFSFFLLDGDTNQDRVVNVTDFNTMAANFNKTGMTYSQGDFNGDGRVNAADFAILAANYGTTIPAPSSSRPSRSRRFP